MLYFCKPIVQRNNHKLENSCEHRQLLERKSCPVGLQTRSPLVFSTFSHVRTDGKKRGSPFLQCKKPDQRLAAPFCTCKWTEKTTDVLFCNAKSQSNGFVDLFAIKTGRGEDRSIG